MNEVWEKINASAVSDKQFLRKSWYDAWVILNASSDTWDNHLDFRYIDAGDKGAAVFPYGIHKIGPFKFASLAGNFIPHRGIPNSGLEPELIEETVKGISEIDGVDGYRFCPVESTDQFQTDLIGEFRRQKWFVVKKEFDQDLIKRVPGTEEEYLNSLSASRHRKLRNYNRKLEKAGDVEYKYFNDETTETWKSVFKDIEKVEANSWVADTGRPRFMGQDKQNYWNRLVQDDWFSKAIKVIIIYLDGEAVSHDVAIDTDEVRFGLDGSYDKKVARLATGILLEVDAFKQAIKFGLKTVRNGSGTDEFKKRWGATEGPSTLDLIVFPPTVSGFVRYLLTKFKYFMDEHKSKFKLRNPFKKSNSQ